MRTVYPECVWSNQTTQRDGGRAHGAGRDDAERRVMKKRECVSECVGLPGNLLKRDEHGLPRIFLLMPGFNREARRRLATVMRSARHGKGSKSHRADNDTIIERFGDPRARRTMFWHVVGSEPPPKGEFDRRLYLVVDYWLLADFEPDLDLLSPLDDQVMRRSCDCWDELVKHMRKWAAGNKQPFDLRYFALWPRVRESLKNWGNENEEGRWRSANATFALSSISGDAWFVEEAKRLCPDVVPYFEGVTVRCTGEVGSDAPAETLPDEGGALFEVAPEDAGGDAEPLDPQLRWRTLGAQLHDIADRLESGPLEPALCDELDEVWDDYLQLKEDCPLKPPVRERVQQQLAALESILLAAARGDVSGLLGADAVTGVVERWQRIIASAQDEANLEQVRLDVERLEREVRTAIESLSTARKARAAAESDHRRLQDEEKAASDFAQRRATRRTLGDLEAKLVQLRRDEESAEETVLAVIGHGTGAGLTDSVSPGEPEEVDTATLDPTRPDAVAITSGETEAGPEAPTVEPSVEPGDDLGAVAVEKVEPAAVDAPAMGASPAVPSPVNDRPFTRETGNLCAPIWQALRTGNAALAFHAASAIRAQNEGVTLPSPALLASVALGQRLQSPGGPIADALRRRFAEIDRNEFESGPEPWRLANNLLLLSACLRPLILAPDTGASGVAEYVHLGAGLESLYEVQQLLGEYGQRMKGNRLDAAALGAVRSKAAWDSEYAQLQNDADLWIERASRFTVKARAALDVWRHWMTQDGPLGRLTALVQSTVSGASVTEVRELCETFRNSGSFRSLVDDTDRKQLKRNRGEDIHGSAFEQLRQKADEAVLLGERWMSLMEAQPSRGDYLSRQLGDLQVHLAKAGQTALDTLGSTVEEDSWGLIVAARLTLRNTLTGLLELFTGTRIPISPEPRPEVVLGEPLLATGRVSLDAEWRPEAKPADLLEAVKSFLVKPGTAREALESYIAGGDLANTQRLLDLVDGNADGREDLTRVFERALSRAREEFRDQSRRAEENISLALAYSLIGENERVDLSTRVAALEFGHASDLRFDLYRQALEEIRSHIDERRTARATELTARLKGLEALHQDHDYSLIETAIEEGDFPVATEYLHRVEQDPAAVLMPAGSRDLFNDFFPERCRQLQQLMEKLDATAVRTVIQERRNVGGISFNHLSPERAAAAATTWTQWTKAKAARATGPDVLRTLLLGLGFPDASVTASKRPGGRIREFTLATSPINERDICQSPHFGSRSEGRYRIACLWDRPSQEDFRQLAGDATTGPATIALYFGSLPEQKRRELSALTRGDRRQSFLLIDELLLLFICGEEDSPLAALFQCCLPFTYTDPFVTTSSVVPPEMFFGRAEELASIKSMDGRCFVYGGRQLGKTALLRQAEREFHDPPEERIAVWIDLKRLARPDEVWVPVWRELRRYGIVGDKVAEPRRAERTSRKIDNFVHALEQWMAEHPKQRVLLLLDEADRFLEFDARDGFPDTRRLKALMEVTERRFKVVFAGLHNVLRTTEQANQPLAHFGEAIEIGPLIRPDDLRAARELVLRPLMAAGFAFKSERRADRILALTNYYPSLIQLYCSKLLHELLRNGGASLQRNAGPRYEITSRHLDSVYARQDLRDEIRSKFLLTLKLDARYNLITYALAYEMQQDRIQLESGATVEDIRRIAESWWREGFERTAEPAFRVLLQEMVGLGVLREVRPGTYTLRNPNVLLLLGSVTEIGEELLRERELPAEYEPRVYRMALPADATGRRRSPLTVSQISDVVGRANGVVVVAGCEAAGIRDVQHAVRSATETGFFNVMEPGGAGGLAAFQRTLDRLTERRSGGTTVLFVGPDCPWCSAWLEHARTRVDRLKSKDNPVRVVFAADPTTLRLILEDGVPDFVPVVALEQWSDAFVREWLQETNQTAENGVRDAILEQTGGWPEFIYEWQPGGGWAIDAAGEADRQLSRLGVEDPHALSTLDGKPAESLAGDEESGQNAQLIRWGELLGLLRIGGDGKVHVDPYVAELIMRV